MKTSTTKITLLSAAFLLVFSSSALALPSVNQKVKLYDGIYGNTNVTGGGEFIFDVQGTTSDYISFCLEKNEHISFGTEYRIASISDAAIKGGIDKADLLQNPTLNSDTVSSKTKWVLYTYLYGDKFSSETNKNALADYVQKVIWFLEDEDTLTGEALEFYNSKVEGYADYSSYDNVVKVMNLVAINDDKSFKQSQLIADPIPEPATMLLFGTGIAGLASMIRRRRMHN